VLRISVPLIGALDSNQAGVAGLFAGFVFLPQNAIDIELCLRLTLYKRSESREKSSPPSLP
jgi:hypothetical protein